jgi:hypothetical protein
MFRSIILFCLLTIVAASLPDDATTWTVVQVNEWVDTLGVSSASTIKAGVTKHGITGNILLVLDDTDLQEELGVSSGVERKKIFLQINQLKDSESEQNAKLTFWELRALNRQKVDYATPLLTVAPRWAITTFDDFPEYCRPAAALGEGHNSVMSWLEWALFPEWYIWTNRDTIMCGLPGFVPYVCFGNLLIGIGAIGLGLASAGLGGAAGAAIAYITLKLGLEIFAGSFAWIYSATIWKILPWFICDILFYFSVYIAPVLNFFNNGRSAGKSKYD